MKKLLSIILAITIVMSANVGAFATNNTPITNAVGISFFQNIEGFFKSLFSSGNDSKIYTFDEISKMTTEEIIDISSKVQPENILGLFETTDISKAFYSDKEKMTALINALEKSAEKYTAKKDNGVITLCEILSSGFYIATNNKDQSLDYLNNRSYRNSCLPALVAVSANKNFKFGSENQNNIIKSFSKLVDLTATNVEVINNATAPIKQFNENFQEFSKDPVKSAILKELIKAICYDFERYAFEMRAYNQEKSIWFGKIDGFIDEIAVMASSTVIDENTVDLINNCIFYCGKTYPYHSDGTKIHKIIENICKTQPEDSTVYVRAAYSIITDFKSKDSAGNSYSPKISYNMRKVALLPKTYTFDDGNITIETGDRVSEEKVERLYWALNEVKSQFIRFIGSDKALEPNNADEKLKIVIFNSPDEYQNNRKIYGYSTDNGGIYIEGVGSFFTYERTFVDSIYSLEELFRHEYTHYLQGKYQVPGLFGEGDFYIADGNFSRITWFEEGMAEFFAGSTRYEVEPRNSMVGGLEKDKNSKMNLKKLTHASYDNDGFSFYDFGYAFVDYMYHKDMELFMTLSNSMRGNDTKSFDATIEKISSDEAKNTDYFNHIDEMCQNIEHYRTPLVSDNYMKNIDSYDLEKIKSDIQTAIGTENSEIKTNKSQFFETFELKTQYTLKENADKMTNWNNMNKAVNEALKSLNENQWNGYKTVTAYFANESVNANNEVVYDVVFHGIYA